MREGALLWICRHRPTFPHVRSCSIIGDEALNCRVRNGTGCARLSMDAGKWLPFSGRIGRRTCRRRKAPKALRQLKGGKDTQEKADRSISTGKLNASLRVHTRPINLVVFQGSSGISYLEAGFPLRCFQRLSAPNIATLLCRWHDNRDTRGSSIPVLSY